MSIGNKVKRVTIQKATLAPDGHGGSVLTWSPRCVVWAHERPLTWRESLAAAQVTAVLSSVLELHFRSDLSVRDRVKIGARTLEVEAVYDPFDTRKELYLVCSEVQ